MRPACEGAEQRKGEGEVEKEFEIWNSRMVRINDDPVGEQQERGGEDDKIVDGEMRSEKDSGEKQRGITDG